MTNYTDIMLDLETMDTGPEAMVCAIGAAAFDMKAGKVIETFYRPIDITIGALGTISPATTVWWMQQSAEARALFDDKLPKSTQAEALADFSAWVKTVNGLGMWGNGVDFDNVILRNCYKMHHRHPPWTYRNSRCFRTVNNMFPHVPFKRVGVHHNAVDDAVTQAEHLMKIYRIHLAGNKHA